MQLKNSKIARFIKTYHKERKFYAELKELLALQKARVDPFSYEYTYRISCNSNGLTAIITKGTKPFCMYYEGIGFQALAFEMGNWVISEDEQRLILDDLSMGIEIDGLTILHDKPLPKPSSKLANFITSLIFFLLLLFMLSLPCIFFNK